MMRVAEHLGPTRAVDQREWWQRERRNPDHKLARDTHLLAEYFTPEQRADFEEYGSFLFESELGQVKQMEVFGLAGRCLRPAERATIECATGLPWMIAVKLVWQSAQRDIECVQGIEGAHLP